jgi:hypothetical protein
MNAKRLGAFLATMMVACAAAIPSSAAPLPAVDVDYPSAAFFRYCSHYTVPADPSHRVRKHVVHFCDGPAALKVRPSTISLSVDGDGYLSNLDWSSWSRQFAAASGLQEVRCFGGTTDPHCQPDRFGYTVPVLVRLTIPVSTPRGLVFTVLKVTRGNRSNTFCLPPAAAC